MIAESTVRAAWIARPRVAVVAIGVVVAIAVGRLLDASRPTDQASPLATATYLYALVLVAGLMLLSAAIGRVGMRRCGVHGETDLEHGLFAIGVGLGTIATVIVVLGLAQVVTTPVLGTTVLVLAALVRRDLAAILAGLPDGVRRALELRKSVQGHGRALALLVPLVEILFGAVLLRAMVPPFENDVLTYHLGGPHRFLELGRIAPLPDIQQANMPLAVNMLYLLGLAFGSEELGGVLHVVLAALAAVATFSLGRRFFGERAGWIAAVTFLSTQLLIVFGAVAFVDYGLTLFDFLAVSAFVIWRDSERRGWLAISGMLVGCALASKLLGGITAVCLGAWLLAVALRECRRDGPASSMRLLLLFGLPAALVAASWYGKNLLWFGNPIWPFLSGNPNDFNMYVGSVTKFAGTEGLLGPLLLPYLVYRYGSLEFESIRPPLALLALPLYALVPKHRAATALLVIAIVHYLVWTQGAHLLRYGLQALPEASIVAAYVLNQILGSEARSAIGRQIVAGLLVVGLTIPTVFSIIIAVGQGSLLQLTGLESRQAYLDRKLDNEPLVTYLDEGHENVSRVLMIGDNRSYYLRQPAWVDISLEVFQEIALAPTAQVARARLAERGISHVLINSNDLAFFVPIDRERRIVTWWERFEANRSGYLEEVATSGGSTLYRVRP